jgi:hypothetical protein
MSRRLDVYAVVRDSANGAQIIGDTCGTLEHAKLVLRKYVDDIGFMVPFVYIVKIEETEECAKARVEVMK